MERRFHRHWGNGGGGDLRVLGQAALLMEASTWVAFAFGVLWRCFPVMPMRVWGRAIPAWRYYRLLSSRIRQRRFFAGVSLLYLLTLAVSIAMVARAFALMPCSFCMKAARRSTLFCSRVGDHCGDDAFQLLKQPCGRRLEVILVGIKMMILLLLIIPVSGRCNRRIFPFLRPPAPGVLLLYRDNLPCLCGLWHDGDAADKVKDPEVIMPRAFLVALALPRCFISRWRWFCLAMYRIRVRKICRYRRSAGCFSAPRHVGYVIVVIGALLATASAITQTCSPCLTSWTTWAANANCEANE